MSSAEATDAEATVRPADRARPVERAGSDGGRARRAATAADEGHPARWWILAVLAAVAFMAQLDLFIVNVALPVIGRSFPARRCRRCRGC